MWLSRNILIPWELYNHTYAIDLYKYEHILSKWKLFSLAQYIWCIRHLQYLSTVQPMTGFVMNSQNGFAAKMTPTAMELVRPILCVERSVVSFCNVFNLSSCKNWGISSNSLIIWGKIGSVNRRLKEINLNKNVDLDQCLSVPGNVDGDVSFDARVMLIILLQCWLKYIIDY